MLGSGDGTAGALPASYHYYDGTGRRNSRAVGNLAYDENTLPGDELSLGGLGEMRKHLVAGFPRPATQLQLQVAISREIIVADHMDLRLVWHHQGDSSRSRLWRRHPNVLMLLRANTLR